MKMYIRSRQDVKPYIQATGGADATPWFTRYRQELGRSLQQEMFDHPVAIVLVVASTNNDPICCFDELSSPYHLPSAFQTVCFLCCYILPLTLFPMFIAMVAAVVAGTVAPCRRRACSTRMQPQWPRSPPGMRWRPPADGSAGVWYKPHLRPYRLPRPQAVKWGNTRYLANRPATLTCCNVPPANHTHAAAARFFLMLLLLAVCCCSETLGAIRRCPRWKIGSSQYSGVGRGGRNGRAGRGRHGGGGRGRGGGGGEFTVGGMGL
jgi:hypothetical protein